MLPTKTQSILSNNNKNRDSHVIKSFCEAVNAFFWASEYNGICYSYLYYNCRIQLNSLYRFCALLYFFSFRCAVLAIVHWLIWPVISYFGAKTNSDFMLIDPFARTHNFHINTLKHCTQMYCLSCIIFEWGFLCFVFRSTDAGAIITL